ncbi:MAG: TonB-dependent receptor [Sphingomonadaceae bacterium]|nr:TonB-dependent receptor [Sphingomonadaceae bacterium]
MRSLQIISATALALALASPACAADNDSAGDADAPLVVTATGEPTSGADVGQAISVITAQDLENIQAVTIADALRTLPSVAVATRGGVGGQSSVFIRGANSSQTLVLIDGVRVNDPSGPNGAFDFGALLTGSIARVEVLRGANSVIWGSQAIGGVVAIDTTPPTDSLQLSAGAEYGYADSARAYAQASGRSGALSGGIGGSWYRSDGISSLRGGNERDGFDNLMLNARLRADIAPATYVEGNALLIDGKLAYDSPFGVGANALPVSDNRQWTARIAGGTALFGGALSTRLSYARTDIRRIGTDPVVFSFNNFRVFGVIDHFEWHNSLHAAPWLTLQFGGEHMRTRSSTSFEGAPADRARDRQSGGFLLATLRPVSGMTLTGGVRRDDYRDYGARTSFAANFAYSPNGDATILRASYAEGFRTPTLTEGQPPFGNPALRPESSKSYDIGVEQKLLGDALRLSATLWQRNSADLIAFSFTTFRSENIELARARGVELALQAAPTPRLNLTANYSFTDARNRTPGAQFDKQLALRPRSNLALIADWQSPWGVKFGATLTMVGDSFDDAANNVRLDGYSLLSLRASIPIRDNVEFFARCDNVTDSDYSVVSGYSTYGRSAYAGVRWRL